jgi:hypothetical protein
LLIERGIRFPEGEERKAVAFAETMSAVIVIESGFPGAIAVGEIFEMLGGP